MIIRHAARFAPRALRRTSRAEQRKQFSSTTAVRADFTHTIIGGGVVGLSIAAHLARVPNTTTLLLERHPSIGTETSSRNSEVIHAGIYYGSGTLKSRFCIRGKQLLYELCPRYDVGFKNTGKWLVAQNDAQMEALSRMDVLCREELGVPMRWVSSEEVEREGEGVRALGGVLESPTTGIVDSHGLMVALNGLFEEAGGVVALNSPVANITPLGNKGSAGWELDVRDGSTGESSVISTETLINAAGLGAVDVHNMIVPESERRQLYFAKGNYFSYASSTPKVTRLIYPAPEPGAGGLGTHLTLDLGGRLRFGPDVEWVDSPDDLAANAGRMEQAIEAIKKYLPAVDVNSLAADYAGIRPKLGSKDAVGSGQFHDFYVEKEKGYEGWVNLLGIESPGLTSSLAIGEYIGEMLYGKLIKI